MVEKWNELIARRKDGLRKERKERGVERDRERRKRGRKERKMKIAREG